MDFSIFAYKDDANIEDVSSELPEHMEGKLDDGKLSLRNKIGTLYNNNKRNMNTDTSMHISKGSSGQCSYNSEGLQELYKSPYQEKEEVLRVIIIGHNPSDQSWTKRHYYANPVNRMWSLLGKKAQIIPPHYTAQNDQDCPSSSRVGFTDLLFGINETNSCKITDNEVRGFKKSLYSRLVAHVHRVASSCSIPVEEAYPRILAFAGVRQWKALFPPNHPINSSATNSGRKRKLSQSSSETIALPKDSSGSKIQHQQSILRYTDLVVIDDVTTDQSNNKFKDLIEFGIQTMRPPDWPAELSRCEVFLLPSSSGAAALTNDQREQPYIELGRFVRSLEPLPFGNTVLDIHNNCSNVKDDESLQIDCFVGRSNHPIEIIEIESD